MAGPFTWLRYWLARIGYARAVGKKFFIHRYSNYRVVYPMRYPPHRQIRAESYRVMWKNLAHVDRLTFLHWSKEGQQMPLLGTRGGILLVRRIGDMNPKTLRVGDVVVHKDPKNLDNLLVRQLAVLEGWQAETMNKIKMQYMLPGECWVLAQNKVLDYKRAYDSRTFGPVNVPDILGRAIYCVRTPENHGPVRNSQLSMEEDSPIIEVEMDMDEMIKNLKK